MLKAIGAPSSSSSSRIALSSLRRVLAACRGTTTGISPAFAAPPPGFTAVCPAPLKKRAPSLGTTNRARAFASSSLSSTSASGSPPDRPTMALSGIPYDDDNVFKKIIEGTIPCYKIFETEHALAFLDAFPMAKGHALLVPKATGYASLIDMPAELAGEVLKELPRLARLVKEATGCDGVNVIQNNGGAAGQVVFHVHFHVVPRWNDDGVMRLGRSGDMVSKEDAAALLQAMQAKM